MNGFILRQGGCWSGGCRRTFRSILDDHMGSHCYYHMQPIVFSIREASNANNQIPATAQPTNEVNDLHKLGGCLLSS